MLRGFDTNQDGIIDPKEVPEDRRRFLNFIGARMGVDFDKPVSIEKLRQSATAQFGSDQGSAKKEPEPLVPGFGVPNEPTTVLAFGVRPPEPNRPASSSSSSSSRANSGRPSGGGDSRSSDDQAAARAQGFANMIIGRYDRNRNGVLDRDEWGELRGDPNQIDRDRDGRITREELIAHMASSMGGRSQGSDGGRESRGGGERSSRGEEPERKPVRLSSPVERLPDGLPDWFRARDVNQDGQVTMAEFAKEWSDTTAREFLQYDLNGDGRITPEECLEAMNRPRSPAEAQDGPEAPAAGSGEPKPEEKKESGGEKPWWMS